MKAVALGLVAFLGIAHSVPAPAAEREGSGSGASSPAAPGPQHLKATPDDDPDLPPGASGTVDKADYLRRRGEHVEMLRGLPHGLPYDPRERAIQEKKRQEVVVRERAQQAGKLLAAWAPIGPMPIPNGQTSGTSVAVSGRTISIAIHPTDPNTLYVGTAQGGLYKSTNGGDVWTPLFEMQLESLAIGAITIDPIDTSIVYVGTGENGFCADCFAGKGLYIVRAANSASPTLNGPFRLDAGAADVFSGRAIGRILVDPADNNNLFVCTASGASGNPNVGQSAIPVRGIYRSTNAQAASPTFAKVDITGIAAPGDRAVVDMVLDPNDHNVLVATVVGAAADGGIYRTANALAATPTFARTRTLPDGATAGRAELAVTLNAGVTTVWAAVAQISTVALAGPACSSSGAGYVTRSTDGGLTWSGPLAGSTGFCGGQCFYDIAIVATQDNTTIHLGGSARGGAGSCLTDVMKRSTNGGTSFARNDNTLHADTHALAIAPSDQSVVYTGNDGGIWRSGDNGTTWVSKNNTTFSATQFMSLAVHPVSRNFSIGGTQDNGTNCLGADGTTWVNCRGGDGGYTLIDRNALDATNVTMYHTFYNQANVQIGFERATDTSFNWTYRGCSGATSNNGMTCADTVLFYAPMEQGPGSPNTIYFGTDRLYRSTDGGDTMTLVSQGPLVAGQAVTTIGISPQDDAVRIVGLRNGRVFATTTGSSVLTDVTSASFPPVNPADPTRKPIGRAVIDPNSSSTAYVTFNHYTVPSGQHVFKTTNLNTASPTWVAAGNGIPDVPVNAFVIDPQDSNALFAGTDIGVYQSIDGGANWAPFGTGLPRVAVFDAEISNVHRVLRIATHGRGLYEIPIPGALLAVVHPTTSTLVTESCGAGNGAIDPGEPVTVSYSIQNLGAVATTNLVATLQATGGVTAPGAPQNYGAIAPGATATMNFSFTAGSVPCGSTVILTFQLQDGATNYGTATLNYVTGAVVNSAPAFTEIFDGVTAPALPVGWTTAQTTATLWATTTAFSDTAPNSAGTDGQTTPGHNSLTSPTFAVPVAPVSGVNPGVLLSFRINYNTESGYDGGVLEISINGGAFQDILAAGGTFVSGGYNGSIGATDSVLALRSAWNGTSNGFITSVVKLPAAALGQPAQLRWRSAYDTGSNPVGGGVRIDTISVYPSTRICSTTFPCPVELISFDVE